MLTLYFKEIVIVEGKTDAQKISSCFPESKIDFLISNGLGFDSNFLEICKKANESRGVIIFTDPDGPGNTIREKINSFLNFKCKNAFVDKKNIIGKKIGVAEADEKEIKNAFKNIIEFKGTEDETISWKEYLDNELNQKQNRVKIASYFLWSEKINSKKLFKWINYTRISLQDLKNILKEKK